MTLIRPPQKSAAFLRAIEFVLPHETEYARGHWGDDAHVLTEHNPKDPGGATRYGIDQRAHPTVKVASLTRDAAIDIYWDEWLAHRLDLLPDRLAIAAFDVYVNGGYPVKWFQHAFNETHLGDKQLAEDNQLGPKTILALKSANADVLLRSFLRQRDARFNQLATKPQFESFHKGWLNRDADLAKFLNVYEPPQ